MEGGIANAPLLMYGELDLMRWSYETSNVFLAIYVTVKQSCSYVESHYLRQSGFSKGTEHMGIY